MHVDDGADLVGGIGRDTSRFPPCTSNHGSRARSRVLSNWVGNVVLVTRAE